jgi:curved DNA binding protein
MSAFEEDLPELASKVTGGEKVSATEESAPAAPVEEEDTTLANSDVCAKYQDAAKVTQFVAGEVAAKCVAGAKVHDICLFGDELITAQCEPMYRNRVAVAGAKEDTAGRIIEKGVAFPCCISVNSVVCHMSPLTSEADEELKDGDTVKIDLGVHIDGYMTLTAHTVIVGHNASTPITGPQADVMHAAWMAAEVAARMIKPGNTNRDVTAAIKQVTDAYGVNAFSASTMHEMKRYVMDGSKMIYASDDPDQPKIKECTFEAGEVYAIDLCMTTGEGKPKEGSDRRTTVYKRKVDKAYSLKSPNARKLFNEIVSKHPSLPFTTRNFEENVMKVGIVECKNHQIVVPYDVMYEKEDAFMCHVKYTILLQNSGNVKVTGLPMPEGIITDKVLPDELKELISTVSIEKKKKDRGNKKKKKAKA